MNMDHKGEAPDRHYKENDRLRSVDKRQPSLSSLIIWNISKALEKDPQINLRRAMRLANERIEHHSHDLNDIISHFPEERHVACAVLAWQQLGHKDTESLYEFIESHRNKILRNDSENSHLKDNIYSVNSCSRRPKGFIDHKSSMDRNSVGSSSFNTYSLIGPVVKLPVDTKFVMRVENTSTCARHGAKKSPKSDLKTKIDAACCLDSECLEKLKEMEQETAELRDRATQLARREAERAGLLERAEAAWRDLELGYQKRLIQAEEKEEDLTKLFQKSVEDRNAYKHACTELAQQFGKRGDIVEGARKRLIELEKQVCERACIRLRLSEESAQGDAAVVDEQCKTVQLERDLQFKEEQARRKLLSMESVMDSTRGLTIEAERAMREELGVIKEHVAEISTQLLETDAASNQIKAELDELRQQKASIFEDLDGCKLMCDSRMQGISDDLNKKRKILNELKEKVIECQCKLPLDAEVEVKRTPSLAALCRCNAEDHIIHSCSCTSVRSTLLSNLLSDLFAGLQAELGDTGSLMPCQLLKCLEDKHNWDRASIVKSNLRSFFSQLLCGELDTAIATSIEKYHATWIGASCVDRAKMEPVPGEAEDEGWQERVLERRAQKLAGELAEQLFQERSDQLVERAKEIVASGPPPCECQPQGNKAAAYPCLVKPPTIGSKKNDTSYPTYVKRTLQDVTLLRTQIEDLKKETIKKEDLRLMEEKITKIVQQASGPENTPEVIPKNSRVEDQIVKQKSIHRSMNTEDVKEVNGYKPNFMKKKNANANPIKKNIKKTSEVNGKSVDSKLIGKSTKKMEQSFAVNVCLLDEKNKPDTLQNSTCLDALNTWNEKLTQSVLSQIPSIKHSRPIDNMLSKDNQVFKNKKKSSKTPCLTNCKCFHKTPSNTSLNKLLESLIKWKGDLISSSIFNINGAPSIVSKINNDNIVEINHVSEISNNKKSENISDFKEAQSQNVSYIESVTTTGKELLPPVTTSEYIGAINLDKSNEHICKCDKEEVAKHDNNINNSNLLFKCLETTKCSCEKCNNMDKKRSGRRNQQSIISKCKDVNGSTLTGVQRLSDNNNIVEKVQLNIKPCKSIKTLSNKNNQTSESNFLPNDRDVLVKFLGVTLTDINQSSASIAKKDNSYDQSIYKTSLIKRKQHDVYSKAVSSLKSDRNNELSDIQYANENDIQYVDEKTECPSKTNQCQFLEIFTDFEKNIDKYKETDNKHEDIQCLSEIVCDQKSCVCCNYDDETKNLEVNTFTLLEKHLKHKLAKFRKLSGNSTSVLSDEEEKVFITILDKVKQVISNCTYNVKCECSGESNTSGSWMRFNNLLEEYLKIKIKRVQCTCIPDSESLDTILPGVLEQVSNLIDNDFKRLKHLCKLEKTNSLRVHEKTNSNSDQNIAKNLDSPQLKPDTPCINVANVSIQGLYNFGIEDKSCDAIQYKDMKDVQTSHNNILLTSRSVEVLISQFCNLNDLNTSASKVETELNPQIISHDNLDSTEITPNELQNEKNKDLDKISSQHSLRAPYVGYTLSCSCDHLSQSYVKHINNIWKMLEINKKLLPNLSYIMHSIPKAIRSENNIEHVKATDTSNVFLIPEPKRAKSISASGGEEIILKDSEEKIRHSDINDHTTNTLDDLVSVKTECLNDDDALYWYDCYPNPRNTKNDMIQKKPQYDCMYSPFGKIPKHGKSDTSIKNNVTMGISKSKNCDCVMVPVCHVKMLVENIESKLVKSQCTCDSLSAQVCPLHSKTLFY